MNTLDAIPVDNSPFHQKLIPQGYVTTVAQSQLSGVQLNLTYHARC